MKQTVNLKKGYFKNETKKALRDMREDENRCWRSDNPQVRMKRMKREFKQNIGKYVKDENAVKAAREKLQKLKRVRRA